MEKKVSMYFQQGASNKEYHAQLTQAPDGGWLVTFQYGRRGASLTFGQKTANPTTYEAASKAYDKLVAEKKRSGYTEDAAGTPFLNNDSVGTATIFVPQLLNAIPESEAIEKLNDPAWCAQEKMDGERRAVQVDCGGVLHGINRKGLATALPKPIADDLLTVSSILGATIVDGEIVGNILYVFDILNYGAQFFGDIQGSATPARASFKDRMAVATETLKSLKHVIPVSTAFTRKEKHALFDRVLAKSGEGLVFKRLDSMHSPGRPASGGDWLKHKFIEQASCVVLDHEKNRRSVFLGLLDDDGKTVPVGKVTILPNFEVPSPGQVVEVQYLYAYREGSLFQPVYKGPRNDVALCECRISQLKFKQEPAEAAQ